ncbi:MAG: histidine kinase [Peptococcaceae bacterium]|nr:histidine kinase [Peptococcaceae bacterium]
MASWLTMFMAHSITIILVSVSITWLIVNSAKQKLARSFIRCQVLVIIWTIGQLLEYTAGNLPEQTVALDILYFATVFIGPSIFFFVLRFAKPKLTLPLLLKILLLLPPVLLYLLYALDPAKGFYYVDYGFGTYHTALGYYVNMMSAYVYIMSSLLLLVFSARKAYLKYKRQMLLIVLAVLLPLVVNAVSETLLALDYTPFAFSLSTVLVLIAIHKYEFTNVEPIALSRIVNSLNDPIVVVDKEGSLVFVNKTFELFFRRENIPFETMSLEEITESIKVYVSEEQHTVVDAICRSDVFDEPNSYLKSRIGKTYSVQKEKILDKDICLGHVIKLSDLTELFAVMDQLKASNDQLEAVNVKLKNLNTVTEQLAIEKERTRIAQHLHDTMGHDLVNMMTLAKLASMEKENKSETLNYLLSLSTQLLQELRNYVSSLDANEQETIVNRLQALIQSMGITQLTIELSISGEETEAHFFAGDAVLDVVREALTNAIRHGQASSVDIVVKFLTDAVKVFVIDNGVGCDDIQYHMGLGGMVKAVRCLGGQIQFSSGLEEGFSIRMSIPVASHNLVINQH